MRNRRYTKTWCGMESYIHLLPMVYRHKEAIDSTAVTGNSAKLSQGMSRIPPHHNVLYTCTKYESYGRKSTATAHSSVSSTTKRQMQNLARTRLVADAAPSSLSRNTTNITASKQALSAATGANGRAPQFQARRTLSESFVEAILVAATAALCLIAGAFAGAAGHWTEQDVPGAQYIENLSVR